MLFEYIQKALRKAEYKVLDDGIWYAETPGLKGFGQMIEPWRNAVTNHRGF